MLKLNNSFAVRGVLFSTSCFFVGFVNGGELYSVAIEKSQEYARCIVEAQATHPELVSCVQSEIGRRKKSIETSISAASKDPSMRELVKLITESHQLWTMYTKKICDTYSELGGQRGELLTENCILNEVAHRKLFVENILEEASI